MYFLLSNAIKQNLSPYLYILTCNYKNDIYKIIKYFMIKLILIRDILKK